MGKTIEIQHGFHWSELRKRSFFEWAYLWLVDIDQYKTGQDILRFGKKLSALETTREAFQLHYEKCIKKKLAMQNHWPERQLQFMRNVEETLGNKARTPDNIQEILSRPYFYNEINNITKLKRQAQLLASTIEQASNQIELFDRYISYYQTIISALDEHLTRIQINGLTEESANVSSDEILESIVDLHFEMRNHERELENMGNTLKNFMDATRSGPTEEQEKHINDLNNEIMQNLLENKSNLLLE